MIRTRTRTRAERRRRGEAELTTIVCVALLLMIISLGGSYVMYTFRETATVKLLVAAIIGILITYVVATLKIGPFKTRR